MKMLRKPNLPIVCNYPDPHAPVQALIQHGICSGCAFCTTHSREEEELLGIKGNNEALSNQCTCMRKVDETHMQTVCAVCIALLLHT